jgi:hypothetical protein
MADETLRSIGATSWSVLTVAPPDAVTTATIVRVVAGSSRDQGDQPRRKQRRQSQSDLGRGDRTGGVGRAHGRG